MSAQRGSTGNYHDFNLGSVDIGISHTGKNRNDCPTYMDKMIQISHPNALGGSLSVLLDIKGNGGGTVSDIRNSYLMEKPHYAAATATNMVPAVCTSEGSLIKLDQTSSIVEHAVLRNEHTGEQMIVTSVPDNNSVYVRRAAGTTSARRIRPGDRLTVIGSAFPEASLRPTPRTYHTERIDFLTQISRTAWGLSQSQKCVTSKCGNSNNPTGIRNFKSAMHDHLKELEMSMWFSERFESFEGSMPIRKMDGFDALVHKHAPQNVFIAGKTTNWQQLETMLESVLMSPVAPEFMGTEPVLISGRKVQKIISDIVRLQGEFNFTSNVIDTWGFQVQSLTIAGKRFNFMYNPLFDTNPAWQNTLRVVNLSTLELKYLCDRKTRHLDYNGGASGKSTGYTQVDQGIDASGGDFLTEFTLHMLSPDSNAIIYGLCGAGCDAPCEYNDWNPRCLITDDCGRLIPDLTGIAVGGEGNDPERLDWVGDESNCPSTGIPWRDGPKPFKIDKCGNIIGECNAVGKCYSVAYPCMSLTEINTSCGIIDLQEIDWTTEDGLAAGAQTIHEFLLEQGGGNVDITVIPGECTTTVADPDCEDSCSNPEEVKTCEDPTLHIIVRGSCCEFVCAGSDKIAFTMVEDSVKDVWCLNRAIPYAL